MADESQILSAMFYAVKAIGLPTAYPGRKFTPPSSGQWLKLYFLPNDDIADPINGNSGNVSQGMFRIEACSPQNTGSIPLYDLSKTVRDTFPRGAIVGGVFRVRDVGRATEIDAGDGIMRVSVTVAYQA